MTTTTEIWIRVPREAFDEARYALKDSASELRSAARLMPAAPHYRHQAERAEAAERALNATPVGVAIERKDVA